MPKRDPEEALALCLAKHYKNGKKRCAVCRRYKPPEDFHRASHKPDGRREKCKACVKAYNDSRVEIVAEIKRLRLYGVTREQYGAMVREQRGRCAGCGQKIPLVVDHDHKTGVVRGLLCRRCNVAVGMIDDSAETARSLAGYLDR